MRITLHQCLQAEEFILENQIALSAKRAISELIEISKIKYFLELDDKLCANVFFNPNFEIEKVC